MNERRHLYMKIGVDMFVHQRTAVRYHWSIPLFVSFGASRVATWPKKLVSRIFEGAEGKLSSDDD
jgi:hypothetical protein